MDMIYQFAVFHAFYPTESIVLTFAIAFLPYLLLRGLVAVFAAGGAFVIRYKYIIDFSFSLMTQP